MLRAQVTAYRLGAAAGVPHAGDEVELRVRLTDRATGRPARGLEPQAWVDVRHTAGATPEGECQRRVGALSESGMMIKHGQISLATPVEDLNSHFLAVLARTPVVAVIDPLKGFGRTKLFTTVPLPAPGAEWTSTPDDRLMFVTIPDSGLVAVIDTHEWRMHARLRLGARPGKVAMEPSGRRLWVADEADGSVTIVDVGMLTPVARFAAGAGPHAFAFSDDGATGFVTARAAGTLAVVDAATGRVRSTVRTGREPVDVAWSPALHRAFVVNEGDGIVAVVDPAAGAVTERVTFAPGIRTLGFAPASGGHGGMMMMGDDDAPPAGGRLAFVLNPREGTLELYDAVARRRLRTLSGSPQADQLTFTSSFAYVRAAGTPEVAMIPLAAPTTGAMEAHEHFPAGDLPPGAVAGGDSLGSVLISQPGMHDAIYVANPAEKMVYSYHYMEGMPVPHGGVTTYEFVPRAIRTVSRRLRETEPGVYSTTVRMEDAGSYDLLLRSASPHVVGCYAFAVAPDPAVLAAAGLSVEPAEAGRTLGVGRATLRYRVADGASGRPVDGLGDVQMTLASTDGWQQHSPARGLGGGVYEAEFTVPEAGLYAAVVEIASRGVSPHSRAPVFFTAGP
jgi:hypothetical protein